MIKNFTKAVFVVLITGAVPALAQQFQVAPDVSGDDYVNKVLINGSSVTCVGGTNATGAGSYDAMLLSGDLNGTFSSQVQIGGAGSETFRAIHKFTTNTTAIAGASNSFSTTPANIDDILVAMLGITGTPLWITVLGTDSIDRTFAIKEGNDGSVIVAGQTKQGGANAKFNGIVSKLNATTGTVIWSKSVGTEYTNEVIYDVQPIGNGYLVLGYSGVNVIGLNDCMAVILNEDGTKSGAFIFGGPGDDDARSYVNGPSSKFFVAGNARNIGQGNGDAFLARFDVTNFPPVLDWFKTYGGTASESFSTACPNSSNNGVILVGSTQSFGTGGDAFAISVDSDGAIVWSKVYGGTGADFFQNVAEDGSGGFVAAGFSNSFPGTNNDAWIVRMDANGSSLCNESTAAFVAETIANNVAYADFTHASLADIVSTDSTLTVRNISALASNNNAVTPNTLCSTVSVDENSAADVVSVYPNPAGETLNLNFGVNAADAKGMIIYNALGAKVYETTLSNITSVFSADISNLANGFYTAIIMMNNAEVTAKFSVAK